MLHDNEESYDEWVLSDPKPETIRIHALFCHDVSKVVAVVMLELVGKLLGSWPGLSDGAAGRAVGPFGNARDGNVEVTGRDDDAVVEDTVLMVEVGVEGADADAGVDGGAVERDIDEVVRDERAVEEGWGVVVAVASEKERQQSWITMRIESAGARAGKDETFIGSQAKMVRG